MIPGIQFGAMFNVSTYRDLTLEEKLLTLKNVTVAILYDGPFTSIPETIIGRIEHLQALHLTGMLLTSLPATIGKCKNLLDLALGNNCLTSLPEIIGDLTKLESLQLWENNLTSLPESLTNLSRLRTLAIGNNPSLVNEKNSLILGALQTYGCEIFLDRETGEAFNALYSKKFTYFE